VANYRRCCPLGLMRGSSAGTLLDNCRCDLQLRLTTLEAGRDAHALTPPPSNNLRRSIFQLSEILSVVRFF
jgi:hypothetical protein